MTFENMSPQQVAEMLVGGKGTLADAITEAIQHFSGRNYVASRRYEYLCETVNTDPDSWIADWFERAEDIFPYDVPEMKEAAK